MACLIRLPYVSDPSLSAEQNERDWENWCIYAQLTLASDETDDPIEDDQYELSWADADAYGPAGMSLDFGPNRALRDKALLRLHKGEYGAAVGIDT